ncbi:MAG TPA: DNA-binding protein [Isosphaeraceae bacterium]|nr:DNA-binding protein [Isosphaeraceae bacterium]
MAQFYTLEEAARVLGMNPEELKTKAQHREVRAFLDEGSWRFRVVDIDELARRRGMGSDAELLPSDLEIPVAPEGGSGDDLSTSEYHIGVADPDLDASTTEVEAVDDESGSGSDYDILLDDLSVPPGPVTGSSSVIIGMATTGRMPGDSDVRLIPDNTAPGVRPSDSDVRLASADFRRPGGSDSDVTRKSPSSGDSDSKRKPTTSGPADSDATLIADDTTDHVVFVPNPGDTAVRQSPDLGSSSEVEVEAADSPSAAESDSDFELSPTSMIDALQPDSGSDFEQPDSGGDFELNALDEGDEFEATLTLSPGDSDVTAADPGLSGINLSRPSDSGINLQMASGLGLGGSNSIELAPLSGGDLKPVPPPPDAPAKPAAHPSPAATPPSSREAEKDIFDDADFEVDVFDSDGGFEDQTMQLEATSDFELEESDSGSEVFAIDEEDVDHNAATALGPAVFEEEEEDEVDFAVAASGAMASAWDVESESEVAPTVIGRAAAAPVLATAAPSAEWGGLWVGLLGVTTLLMLFLAFVSMDLVRNLYDYRGDSPASGIVRALAGLFG